MPTAASGTSRARCAASAPAAPSPPLAPQRDPARYGVPAQLAPDALDAWLRDRLLLGCVRELAEHGMVGGRGWGGGQAHAD